MAKKTALQIVNQTLREINQTVLTDFSSISGQAQIALDYINQAQEVLFNEENWYSLYTTRTFSTVASTATVALASDFGRGVDLINLTSNMRLEENYIKVMDFKDSGALQEGTPELFALTGTNYEFYPIPNAVYSIRERYWAMPTDLSAVSDTSALPIEAQPALLHYVKASVLGYLNRYELSQFHFARYNVELKRAMKANKRKLDHIDSFRDTNEMFAFGAPRLPTNYPRR